MADSINNKAKEYYDNDDTGGSLNNNLKDFLKQQGAEGNSLNTLWRNYAYGEGGNSLNTRLGKLWGTSGSLIKRWKDVLGLTWDDLKLFFNARRNDPELLLSGATSFDGSGDYIQLASDGRTDFANQSFTISAWIKPSTIASDNTIFSYDFTSHASPYYAMHLRTMSSGRISLNYNNGAGSNDSTTSGNNAITAGVWQHVSATYTSGTQKLYVDGSVVASGTHSHTITFYDQEVWIGKANFSGSEFNGSIANVGIWNRALSASEIESVYWKGQYADLKGTELTNLVSWYNLKDTPSELGSETLLRRTFDSGTTGWSAFGSNTLANVNGEVKITYADNIFGATYFINSSGGNASSDLTVGGKYKLQFDARVEGGNSLAIVRIHTISEGLVDVAINSTMTTYTTEFTASSTTGSNIRFVITSGESIFIDNLSLKPLETKDAQGSNNGFVVGATTLTDAYSASSPFLPRIQDKASDTIANYGEVYGGNAVSFDGSSDFVNIGQPSNLNFDTDADDFTIAMWFKIASGDTGTLICKGGDTSGDRQYHIYYSSSDYIAVNIGGTVVNTNAYDDGNWHHVAVVNFDDSGTQKFRIYIDGLSVGVGNSGSGSNSLDVLLGARRGSDNTNTAFLLSGSTNNVKIFNTELTQDQVRQLYIKPELTLPTGIASSALKLDMPMQEGSGTAILDGSGNQNHGTGSGITWANGQEYGFQHPLVRSNNPMVFDGSNDYVDTGASPRALVGSSSAFTVSAWINAQDDDNDYIVGAMESGAERFYFRVFDVSGTGYIRWGYGSSASSDTDAPISLNQWHHVVWTYDNTNAKVYVDGSLKNTTSLSGQAITNTDNLYIGALNNNGSSVNYWKGFINDVAIWDSALTANEITALYNSGLPLLPTTDSGNYASSSDLVGYWRNDGVTTWLDRSTNSNNGTVSGSPASIIVPEGLNEGRDSQGYYFSDSNSISSGIRFKGAEYISVQDSESLSFGNGTSDSPFSLEAWIKPNDVTNFEVFAKGIYNSTGEYLFGFEADDKLKFYLFDESVASTTEGVLYNTALTSSEGQWMHIVGTYDGRGGTSANAGMKIYLNGSQVNNATESAGTYVAMENLSANLEIGKYSSNYAKGSIDEAKVYAKELSATEVLKNYNNGKSAHSN